jgi:hypothetical protein
MNNTKLYEELKQDVDDYLKQLFNYHYDEIPEEITTKIINNVIETSAYKDEGYYNDTDIVLGFRRITIDSYNK